ncbi:MAG TPA: hypothetical protein VFO52_01965 [Longimicrobiales bacterium]|nr:hypothetical protein [Longimicrobiales bacterium]
MLGRDQIKAVVREIDRSADERIHNCDDRFDQQQLWEVVRRASRAIEAVTEMEAETLAPEDRVRRARYLVSELESALDAARRASVVVDWHARRAPTDEV